ncbi:uncharacterized protein LOC117122697 [Anneissia japonica]|uniref:uncharacterized protein LOC117122697 n=1 Tax=Anneissia japonica TaxID=1529436 RepID=UPI0014254D43|nr:uncharacterized protein LOC117122697 [Anneissia japonica]
MLLLGHMAVQTRTQDDINLVTETEVSDSSICTHPQMCPSSLHSMKEQLFRVLLTFGMLICLISTAVMISYISSQRVLINHLLAVEESRSDSTNIQDHVIGKDDYVTPTTEPNTYRGKVTYQRWGRATCPPFADLVYKGFMAGGVEGFSGGGVNYLCLPEQPSYGFTVPDVQLYRAPIGATEYRLGQLTFTPMAHLHAADVLCAVCLANRSAIFVMPAKSTCPSDWTLEYSGYLMGAREDRKRAEFVCVDGNAAGREGTTNANTNIATSQIFIAETRCVGGTTGGLPCPPYVNGAELPCAVCTR